MLIRPSTGILQQPGSERSNAWLPATGCYSLTVNSKTYDDPKVREAIALSIDRKAICDSILHGTATVPTSYIPAGIIGHDDSLPEFEYDPEQAKSLLARGRISEWH